MTEFYRNDGQISDSKEQAQVQNKKSPYSITNFYQ